MYFKVIKKMINIRSAFMGARVSCKLCTNFAAVKLIAGVIGLNFDTAVSNCLATWQPRVISELY